MSNQRSEIAEITMTLNNVPTKMLRANFWSTTGALSTATFGTHEAADADWWVKTMKSRDGRSSRYG